MFGRRREWHIVGYDATGIRARQHTWSGAIVRLYLFIKRRDTYRIVVITGGKADVTYYEDV